jgi:BASS family bile acid:Na+ symporter
MIGRALERLAGSATPILAGGVFVGIAWPALAHLLRPVLVPIVFAVMALAFLRLEWGAVRNYGRRPGLGIAVLVWLLLACPALVAGAVRLFDLPPALSVALVLAPMTTPIFASVAIAMLIGLDAPLAVVALVLTTILVPLTLPWTALSLLGLDLSVDIAALMLRLGMLLGGALVVALALRRLAGDRHLARHARAIDGLAVLCFLVFAIAIMDGVGRALAERPHYILLSIAAAFALNIVLQILGTLCFAWLPRRQALTIGFLSGNRNLALLLAALADTAEFDVLVFFALGQIPIYVLPALLAPVYRRLTATTIA